MNLTIFKSKNEVNEKWYLIDAKNKNLGRLSSSIAYILRGKNSSDYAPNTNLKHHVIIINAKEIHVTGDKNNQKLYRRHSGRPGGMKIETFQKLSERIPTRIIEHSIKGMLPKGPLGRKLFTQLKVYEANNHPHEAQKPEIVELSI
uniref:ribosomal protein L13 n=1 Tax=Porphyridium aerugineum TaxID=2792 RepID=UPI001FCD0CC0|nr:ribosomal protein L13 [Porphyridium aerugineum]UNJ17931.1 ribosomal protein L13 [Porphyridium aerugineum]